jgi:hypothetical protein
LIVERVADLIGPPFPPMDKFDFVYITKKKSRFSEHLLEAVKLDRQPFWGDTSYHRVISAEWNGNI